MADDNSHAPAPVSARAEIDAFLEKARSIAAQRQASAGRGRLLFALDATMSRQPTWDMACSIQADMFREAASAGGLDIQLIYYRGFGECRATRWVSETSELAALMGKIDCRSGNTQIGKILSHARRENSMQKLNAVVFVGDAMEESADDLRARAGELGLCGVPVFVFQEGDDPAATIAFRDIARLSNGAYCRFSAGSALELAELLRAVAAYASGGLQALQLATASPGAAKLLAQLR
jgi:hypothetical protein